MGSQDSETLPHSQNDQQQVRLECADIAPYLDEYRMPMPPVEHADGAQPQPWMLVNWPFLDRLADVETVLREHGIEPTSSFDITGYTTAARYLYPYSTIDEADFDTWGYYAASRLAANGAGELGRVLLLDPRHAADEASYNAVLQAKRAVRERLGTITFAIASGEQEFVTEFRSCHTPDFGNTAYELAVMRQFEDSREGQRAIASGSGEPESNVMRENLPIMEVPNAPMLLLVLGPSGAGKDSVIAPLVHEGVVSEARPATTRARRMLPGREEPLDKYVWMRAMRPGETLESYQQALIDEYELVECAYHNGNFYGLPASSLERALGENDVTVIVTDNAAAGRIQELMRGRATCVSVFVLPDSLHELEVCTSQLDNPAERMAEAITMIDEAPRVANYLLINSRMDGGLVNATMAMLDVIHRYRRKDRDE